MARRSVEHNHLEDRIDIVTGDIKEAAELFRPAFFDVITTNPPYMLADHGIRNPDDAKAVARHETPLYAGRHSEGEHAADAGQEPFSI